MTWLWTALSRLTGLFGKKRFEKELDQEMRCHIELMAEENMRRGMSSKDAWQAARRSFGGIDQAKEDYRYQRGLPMIETMMQDLRYAVRVLTKNYGFTIVAVLALALGTGANTAIFSVVNAVLLRPLPFKDPDRIVALWESKPKAGYDQFNPSPANMADWQSQSHIFEATAFSAPNASLNLAGDDNPEHVTGALVSANLFQILRVEPIRGRVFLPEEDVPGKNQVAIVSYKLWEHRYGKDPNLIGRSIMLNGSNYTVIGIMPVGFQFPGGTGTISKFFTPQPADVWLPLALTPSQLASRSPLSNNAIARLEPGVTIEQARVALNAIQQRIAQQYPNGFVGSEVRIVPLHSQVAGPIRPVLYVLLGAVAFVLLIACVNVANLLLSRASSRQREIAIRAAMGASRMRIIRQLLTESLLLAATGGTLGILLAQVGLRLLTVLLPANFPRAQEINLDLRVLSFTLMISLATGIVFGLVPAIQASKFTFNDALKEGGRGSTEGFRHNRFRSLLVITEVALSLILLVGAGLMVQSFLRLQQINTGFDPNHVLTINLSLPKLTYPTDIDRNAFLQRLIEQSKAIPGVVSASATTLIPMGGNNFNVSTRVEGRDYPPGGLPGSELREITPEYLDTMKIPLIKGRHFSDQDAPDAPIVFMISQKMAQRTFPDEDPIGKVIMIGSGDFKGKIVGIVGDVKDKSLEGDADDTVYCNYAQAPFWPELYITLRTSGDPMAVAGALRSAVASIDKRQSISQIKTMEEIVAGSISEPRFRTLLLGLFALISLILAMVGIYGVMSYSASQRTHEIGIRMALGAQKADVLKLVVSQGLLMATIGVAIGLVGSFLLTRLLSDFLYNVRPADPATFAITALVLMIVALLACFIPARRAAKVDPMIALRYE